MSWAFISALTKDPQQTYVELLNSVRDLLETNYSQKPQLSCSHPLGMLSLGSGRRYLMLTQCFLCRYRSHVRYVNDDPAPLFAPGFLDWADVSESITSIGAFGARFGDPSWRASASVVSRALHLVVHCRCTWSEEIGVDDGDMTSDGAHGNLHFTCLMARCHMQSFAYLHPNSAPSMPPGSTEASHSLIPQPAQTSYSVIAVSIAFVDAAVSR